MPRWHWLYKRFIGGSPCEEKWGRSWRRLENHLIAIHVQPLWRIEGKNKGKEERPQAAVQSYECFDKANGEPSCHSSLLLKPNSQRNWPKYLYCTESLGTARRKHALGYYAMIYSECSSWGCQSIAIPILGDLRGVFPCLTQSIPCITQIHFYIQIQMSVSPRLLWAWSSWGGTCKERNQWNKW